jgi:cytoskeletal protein CcmA (bactofilin family)
LGYLRGVGKSTTLIANRTRVGGRVETDGDVVVEGRLEGSVSAGGRVTVAESGVVIAQIDATRAEIDGVVIGDVVCAERINVSAGARVVGDLRAPDVTIASGAIVDGKVDRRGAERHRDDPAREWASEPLTEPRARTTLRDVSIPLVRPGRPAARPAPTDGPPSLPRPVGRAKLVPRPRRLPPP